MNHKRNVEIFSAGCGCCDEAVALVRQISCPSCNITVHDMRQENVAQRARQLGIRQVPSVVVDGKLADCCVSGINEQSLRNAGIGAAL